MHSTNSKFLVPNPKTLHPINPTDLFLTNLTYIDPNFHSPLILISLYSFYLALLTKIYLNEVTNKNYTTEKLIINFLNN